MGQGSRRDRQGYERWAANACSTMNSYTPAKGVAVSTLQLAADAPSDVVISSCSMARDTGGAAQTFANSASRSRESVCEPNVEPERMMWLSVPLLVIWGGFNMIRGWRVAQVACEWHGMKWEAPRRKGTPQFRARLGVSRSLGQRTRPERPGRAPPISGRRQMLYLAVRKPKSSRKRRPSMLDSTK